MLTEQLFYWLFLFLGLPHNSENDDGSQVCERQCRKAMSRCSRFFY